MFEVLNTFIHYSFLPEKIQQVKTVTNIVKSLVSTSKLRSSMVTDLVRPLLDHGMSLVRGMTEHS